jgi:hypothetical protein
MPRSGHSAPGDGLGQDEQRDRDRDGGERLEPHGVAEDGRDGVPVVAALGQEARRGARDAEVGEEGRDRADRHGQGEVAVHLGAQVAAQEEGDEGGDRGRGETRDDREGRVLADAVGGHAFRCHRPNRTVRYGL